MSNDIRHYIRLVEGAWKLGYQYGYRSWWNSHTNEFVKVSPHGSHAKDAVNEPEKYKMEFPGIEPKTVVDRDPRILGPMCAAGWVRVAGQDRNNPNTFMIIEGADINVLKKLAKRFFMDMDGELKNVTLKVRNGDGHAGEEIALRGVDEVKAVLMGKGELPAAHQIDANDSMI
jgi:hypothetical protein